MLLKFIAFTCVVLTAQTGLASTRFYSATRLGLYGAPYTAADGLQESTLDFVDAFGRAYGLSTLHAVNKKWHDSWGFDPAPGQVLRLNPADGIFTDLYGRRQGLITSVNTTGMAVGTALAWDSTGNPLGDRAWVYDLPTQTRQIIGLPGTEYENASGSRDDAVGGVSDTGFVIGSSRRYDSSIYTRDVFIHSFSGNATRKINVDFLDNSWLHGASLVNDSGNVAGSSGHAVSVSGFSGTAYSTWAYDHAGNQTNRIGLFDAVHTGTAGYQVSRVGSMNSAGFIVGSSDRFKVSNANNGTSAFVYSPLTQTTTPLGLFDSVHASPTGYRQDGAGKITEDGIVPGVSRRFYSSAGTFNSSSGQSAWLFDTHTSTYTTISKHGAIIGDDGTYESPIRQTPQEHWLGSTGNSPGNALRIWDFNPETGVSKRVDSDESLHPDVRTNNDHVLAVNEAGQVLGNCDRYHVTSGYRGNTAWFYDPATDETTALIFSMNSSGSAYTYAQGLDDAGVVYGYYREYEPASFAYVGFRWSLNLGLERLNSLILNDSAIARGSIDPMYVTPDGAITGMSYFNDTTTFGDAVVRLETVVPEPICALPLTLLFFNLRTRR